MGTVQTFEDLETWQKARVLNREIYAISKRGSFFRDFALRDQIRKASISVMSNIAEGFERNRPGEFHQFLSVAKGSCAEVRSHLYAAHDAGYLEQGRFAELLVQAEEVGRIIGGLRVSVAGQKRQLRDSNDSPSSTQHSAQSTQH